MAPINPSFIHRPSRSARNPGFIAALICFGLVASFFQPCGAGTNDTDPVTVPERPDAAWVPTGDLTSPRANCGISPLMDGRILVSGGFSSPDALNTAEIYDPMTGTWSPTGSLIIGRDNHTQTLLNDGRVLVTGGGATYVPAEIFDPATATWSFTGDMVQERFVGNTATLLADGRVLVTGGLGTDGAEIFDPATDNWSSTRSASGTRFDHTATLLDDGTVLIAGGADATSRAVATAEIFDPSTEKWRSAKPMRAARQFHTATLLADGQVLVAGGSGFSGDGRQQALKTAELYDPATRKWRTIHSLNHGRFRHTATLLPSGQVLVAAGAVSNRFDFTATAELFDPVSSSWLETANLTQARYGHGAALLPDASVIAVGGFGPTSLSSAEVYLP